jgi:crotonobetainyl-CoA:carnitine CoA-transferase CaiB-like acyl-CoA transferase
MFFRLDITRKGIDPMKPLEGIKIVDMTTFLAAPTVGRVLGEWGADVIKVEAPKGDPGRTQGAVFNMHYEDDENLGFDVANMNKRFITVNLKKDSGKKVMYDLLAEADVFLTNTRTKSLSKLGIDYQTLSDKFPELIFAQVLGYGENGPEKDTAGFDATAYMSRGGVLGTTLEKGASPMNPANGYGDFQVSMCLASGICGALVNKMKTGKGDKVTVSLHHAAIFMQNIAMVSAQYGNQYPKTRKENANPFNNTYKTSDDKWMVICFPEYNKDFDQVMSLIGRADLVGDERYSDIDYLNQNNLNREFIDLLDQEMSKRTLAEWVNLFKENDLPCEACYEPLDIYDDEQVWANDILRKIDYPTGAERMIPTNPVRFSSMDKPDLKISKAQGASTIDILKEHGYSKEEIESLIAEGAVVGEEHIK